MQEKVARKQDKKTIIKAINNYTTAMTSKLSVTEINTERIKDTLDKLGDKVTNLEQKLNVTQSEPYLQKYGATFQDWGASFQHWRKIAGANWIQ